MNCIVLNQQKNHPLLARNLRRLVDWLAMRLEERMAPEKWEEVCLLLVDDTGIVQTNREYFGKDRPTDVISFRYDPIPGEDEAWSGDLIVNVDRAMGEGRRRGSPDRELALYIAHGFDHLSGADDNTPEERRRMRATETAWLRQAGKEGALRPLFKSGSTVGEQRS